MSLCIIVQLLSLFESAEFAAFCCCVPDNEVNGLALLNLTESDIAAMFPGKVGISRALIVLLNSLNHPQQQVHYQLLLELSVH